jgi:hypothetical protein
LITQQPADTLASAGHAAAIWTAVDENGAATYQWRKNSENLANGGSISGADSPVLVISTVQQGDAGSYDVLVSNACGTITSTSATLTVVNSCPADIEPNGGNGFVNIDDLLEIIGEWGPCPAPCPEDIDGNGFVNIDDLLAVINAWGACP